jgi:hypothetical protein
LRSPLQVLKQRCRVGVVDNDFARRTGNHGNDIGISRLGVNSEPNCPRACGNGDMLGGATDADVLLPGKFPASKDRHGRNQQVLPKRQGKARPEEELAAVGSGDLAGLTTQLQPRQGRSTRLFSVRRLAASMQGGQKAGIDALQFP